MSIRRWGLLCDLCGETSEALVREGFLVGNLSNPQLGYFERLGEQFELLYLRSQTLVGNPAA